MTFLRAAVPLAVAASLFVGSAPAHAQEAGAGGVPLDRRAVFDIVTENDFYASTTDRWYTTGTRLGYLHPEQRQADLPAPAAWLDRQLEGLGFFGPANTRWGINLGQHIYTPSDVSRFNPDPKDHPYAGYAFFDFMLMRRTESYQDRFTVQAGLVGPGSWGRNSQDFVHRLLNQDVSHGWKYQLRQEWALGLGFDRTWRLPANKGTLPLGLELDALPSLALAAGNVAVYAQGGGRLRVGSNLHMDYGPSRVRPAAGDGPSAIHGKGEFGWYVFAGAAGRAVGRDIFIEGNTFKPSRGLNRQSLVADMDIGAALLIPVYDRYVRLSYTQDWRTQEFVGQKRYHHFGSFNLSYAW